MRTVRGPQRNSRGSPGSPVPMREASNVSATGWIAAPYEPLGHVVASCTLTRLLARFPMFNTGSFRTGESITVV